MDIIYLSDKLLVGYGDSCLAVVELWSTAFDEPWNNQDDVDSELHMRPPTAFKVADVLAGTWKKRSA
jgi:hypothetical protein